VSLEKAVAVQYCRVSQCGFASRSFICVQPCELRNLYGGKQLGQNLQKLAPPADASC
jgi:hypothetical protein